MAPPPPFQSPANQSICHFLHETERIASLQQLCGFNLAFCKLQLKLVQGLTPRYLREVFLEIFLQGHANSHNKKGGEWVNAIINAVWIYFFSSRNICFANQPHSNPYLLPVLFPLQQLASVSLPSGGGAVLYAWHMLRWWWAGRWR